MSIIAPFARVFRRLALAAGTVLAGWSGAALAQAYPSKPITIVVPFAAGGPSDTLARLFAQSMAGHLNGQVIVENTAGAGSTVGIARVAKSAPDGYTLLFSHISHAASAALYANLSYDPHGDFAPIGMATDGASAIIGRKDFPAANLGELIARAKAEGGKINWAHAGIGSGSHLCGMMFQQALGVKFNEIPYRGTGPAMNDLVTGKVDLSCDQITTALPQLQAKAILGYGVTSPGPAKGVDLPPVAAAIPGFRMTLWHGVYAPKGTPPEVISKLNGALKVALKDPKVLARLEEWATAPATEQQATPAHLGAHLAAEIASWRKSGLIPLLMKKAGETRPFLLWVRSARRGRHISCRDNHRVHSASPRARHRFP
jgi:tripartite-type tricarboxylate transporter receptor subunit TctC